MSLRRLILVFVFVLTFVGLSGLTVDGQTDDDFSQYLNLVKGAEYDSEITVSIISSYDMYYNAPKGERAKKVQKRVVREDIGFYINGEYYTDSVELKKHGHYRIKVVPFFRDENVKIPYDREVLETFMIYINLEDKPKLYKETFYYEHYLVFEDLINDINNNLSDGSLSKSTVDEVSRLYNKVMTSKDFDKSLNQTVVAVVDGHELKFKLKSVLDPNNKGSITFANLEDRPLVLEMRSPLVIQNMYKKVEELCSANQGFCLSGIDVKEEGHLKIEFAKTMFFHPEPIVNLSAIKSYEKSSFKLTIQLIDNMDNIYNIERDVYYINKYKLGNNNINIKIDFEEEELSIKQYSKVNKNLLFKDAELYAEINVGDVKIKDYNYFEEIDVIYDDLDTNFSGNTEIVYLIKTSYKDDIIQRKRNVKVLDINPPKILKKYNKIFLDENNSFVDQIRIIDDVKVSEEHIGPIDMEKLKKEGFVYVEVYAKDTSGNETLELIPVFYYNESDLSFWEKKINPFFWKLKNKLF